jgi:hypothetical protein
MSDLEKAIIEYDGNGKMPYCDLVWGALKKQIPKKLIHTEHGLKCPSCNVMFLIKYDRNIYCQECGQLLDFN